MYFPVVSRNFLIEFNHMIRFCDIILFIVPRVSHFRIRTQSQITHVLISISIIKLVEFSSNCLKRNVNHLRDKIEKFMCIRKPFKLEEASWIKRIQIEHLIQFQEFCLHWLNVIKLFRYLISKANSGNAFLCDDNHWLLRKQMKLLQ